MSSPFPLPGVLWASGLLLLATGVAFWRSAEALLPLMALDQPVGLAPAMPLLACWLCISSNRARVRDGLRLVGQREAVIDAPVAAALVGVAGWLVWQAPQTQGWYYWSSRLDLLAAALFVLGLAVICFGLQTLVWNKWACLYVLLIWPEPLARAQSVLAPPMATLTAALVRPVATYAHLGLAPAGVDPSVFSSASAPGWTFVIGDACAGLNACLTVALLALPVAQHLSIPLRRSLVWFGAGLALAFATNVLRIVLVFAVADTWGPDIAMGWVHPVAGAVLLVALLLWLWWTAPRAYPRTRVGASVRAVGVAAVHLPRWTLMAVCALVLAFAAGSTRLSAFEPLAPIGPPGAVLSDVLDYVQLPEGWQVEGRSVMAWQQYFGPDSSSYAMSFRSVDGALIKGQLVATPDQGRLSAYSLEACRVYHGDAVVGERRIDLGSGGVGALIDTWDRGPFDAAGRMSLLYWEAPFSLEGRTMHARLALFVVEADEELLPSRADAGIAPGGHIFDRADTALAALARGMTGELMAGRPMTQVSASQFDTLFVPVPAGGDA